MTRVRIKMCGITKPCDLAWAAALGVDAIGFIFVPQSPRYLSVLQAQKLAKLAPPFLDLVAVLANPTAESVWAILEAMPIHYLQFHGQESPQFCEQFNKPYIKGIAVISTDAILKAQALYESASALLLDTFSTERQGGTGKTFDWSLIPNSLIKPVILAGGLHADNVAEALKQYKPYAIDVSSGIEQSPGIKNHQKMSQLVEALWGKQ